jgi:hypothetical protein
VVAEPESSTQIPKPASGKKPQPGSSVPCLRTSVQNFCQTDCVPTLQVPNVEKFELHNNCYIWQHITSVAVLPELHNREKKIFPLALQPQFGPWPTSMKSRFHFDFLDLRQSVGLLGRVISSSHTHTYTNTKYPCPGWDSNPRSRLPSERRQSMP